MCELLGTDWACFLDRATILTWLENMLELGTFS
jgi:hypothetical protein